MRVDLSKTIQVSAGDLLRVHCSIPEDVSTSARIEIFSAVGDYELSPHVPLTLLDVVSDGKPSLVKPTRATLHSKKTHHTFNIVAEEDSTFQVKQEIDILTDRRAKVKVKVHGKTAQRIQRFVRTILNRIGCCSNASQHRRKRNTSLV